VSLQHRDDEATLLSKLPRHGFNLRDLLKNQRFQKLLPLLSAPTFSAPASMPGLALGLGADIISSPPAKTEKKKNREEEQCK